MSVSVTCGGCGAGHTACRAEADVVALVVLDQRLGEQRVVLDLRLAAVLRETTPSTMIF